MSIRLATGRILQWSFDLDLTIFFLPLASMSDKSSGYYLRACTVDVPICQATLVPSHEDFPQDRPPRPTQRRNLIPTAPSSKSWSTAGSHGENPLTRSLSAIPRSRRPHDHHLKTWFRTMMGRDLQSHP